MPKYFLDIILLLILFNFSAGQKREKSDNTCSTQPNIVNKNCFTDIIQFNQKDYSYGRSVISEEGDLIIEYSLDSDHLERLFYGIKSDGRNYFSDNSFIKVINLDNDGKDKHRKESINCITKIEDSKTGNIVPRIISITSSCIEIYDPDISSCYCYDTNDDFKSQVKFYQGFENNGEYYFGANVFVDYEYKLRIYKLKGDTIECEVYIAYDIYRDTAISLFKINDNQINCIYLDRSNNFRYAYYYMSGGSSISFFYSIPRTFENIFYKAILLNNYFALIYLNDNNDNTLIIADFEETIKFNRNFYTDKLNPNPSLNDFIKYDDYRLALISKKMKII